ncbi:helix-turn-helix domain-containing protein [Isoptericola sp. b441]|uniref:Helix-turn-helix domain-containing protein n=1 Tax=Actinotalea lenta TaxID=3064654 RepID=A0ABT9D9E3_9CELL|nr:MULTISPECIES: helix-turn-helix domain-containing protein [unclassified Isoptericola]MDO8107506.1 helix-turn-helix domain-containing protein [Isoptericola sp. b441]MDO8120834.1 helix-turn-helix domain-containing protein [Isoptericola sp. b490]
MSSKLPKGSRITGENRSDLAGTLIERYRRGESIRSIADDIGRSYGFVHGLLAESGVAMRSRGGATRGKAAEERRAALRNQG